MRKQTDRAARIAVAVRRHEGGFVMEGPGFYIWDEDPREVLRVARELERGNFTVSPSQRMLLMEPGRRPASSV